MGSCVSSRDTRIEPLEQQAPPDGPESDVGGPGGPAPARRGGAWTLGPPRPADAAPALLRAAAAGRADIVDWLLWEFGVGEAELCSPTEASALAAACRGGHAPVVQRLLAAAPRLAAHPETGERILRIACRHGHRDLAQWAAERFRLETANARACDNYALRWACIGGHLATVHWLVDEFSLTAADARAGTNCPLRLACEGGHLPVARWLVARFGLDARDARALENYALVRVCAIGRLDVAQWLVATFGLTSEDVGHWTDSIERRASARNDRAFLAWFAEFTARTPLSVTPPPAAAPQAPATLWPAPVPGWGPIGRALPLPPR